MTEIDSIDKDAIIAEQKRILRILRGILRVPQAHSIIDHAEGIMEKLYDCNKGAP